jgi:ferric-dicitrate binding protein FerR (iron transport regulator)
MISRAMPEHVHVHVPHELAEPRESTTSRERWLEIAAALMLSLATLGIAWSGYQAAKWSGLQAQRYTQASTARSLANRTATLAAQDRTQDLLNFNRWLEVDTDGNTELADLYQRRFRDEFRPAFERWLAEDPLHNKDAIASPLLEKNYVLANTVKADKLEALGDLRFEQGKAATEHADDYVFATVFFAVVLFFAGISLRFGWLPMRLLILGLGAALLVYGGIRLLSLPTL